MEYNKFYAPGVIFKLNITHQRIVSCGPRSGGGDDPGHPYPLPIVKAVRIIGRKIADYGPDRNSSEFPDLFSVGIHRMTREIQACYFLLHGHLFLQSIVRNIRYFYRNGNIIGFAEEIQLTVDIRSGFSC